MLGTLQLHLLFIWWDAGRLEVVGVDGVGVHGVCLNMYFLKVFDLSK